MAVTYEAYTVPVSWTPDQFFDQLQAAFVDAGITVFDRFSSGAYTHLVAEVVYDPTKVYGKRYYRFLINSGLLYCAISNGWNATTHVPTGDNYLDYHGNASATTTTGFMAMMALSSTTSAIVKRYTSGIDSDFSVFAILSGTSFCSFWMVPNGAALQPWVDLAKTSFGMIHFPHIYTTGYCIISMPFNLALQRDCYSGNGMTGGSNHSGYSQNWWNSHYRYLVTGRSSYSYGGNWPNQNMSQPFNQNSRPENYITLPVNDSTNNPLYTSDKAPVFAGVPYNAYIQDALPADFGIAGLYSNASTPGSQLIVQAGVEEWEIVAVRNNTNSPGSTYPSGAFVARTL